MPSKGKSFGDDPLPFRAHKVTSSTPFSLLQLLSFALVGVVFVVQFFSRDGHILPKRAPPRLSSISHSPSAQLLDQPICENSHPFQTELPMSRLHKKSLLDEAKRVAAEFELTDDEVRKSVVHFMEQMNEGLAKNATTMSQIPTYVTGVPNGKEKGLYLAVDLGGTNFRVCSIQLNGDSTFNLTQSKVPIPKEMMQAKTAKVLFAFLAKQIEAFLCSHHSDHFECHVRPRQRDPNHDDYEDHQIYRLGFTFSFPVHQIGINRGTLIRWTKGFDIPDAIGQDVCALLQEQIDLLRLPVRVAALVNDTVGTLMSRSYTSPSKHGTVLGAIFGTGTNGAYIEKLSKLTKPLEGEHDKSTGEMIINTEWGSFDNELSVLPKTAYDAQLDRESVNPGIQMFEKRVSGMFLGEILRIVILSLIANKSVAFCRDDNSSHNEYNSTTTISEDSPIFTQWKVDSSILSIFEADNTVGLRALRQSLDRELGISAASHEDAQALKEIAHAIGVRAARLAGVAIAAVVLQSGRLQTLNGEIKPTLDATAGMKALHVEETPKVAPEETVSGDNVVDIGVDGSLAEFYPGFEDHLRSALMVVPGIGEEGQRKIRIGIAKDGSGVGAALIAHVAGLGEQD